MTWDMIQVILNALGIIMMFVPVFCTGFCCGWVFCHLERYRREDKTKEQEK